MLCNVQTTLGTVLCWVLNVCFWGYTVISIGIVIIIDCQVIIIIIIIDVVVVELLLKLDYCRNQVVDLYIDLL